MESEIAYRLITGYGQNKRSRRERKSKIVLQLDSQLEGLQKGEMAQFTLCNGHQLTDLVVLLLLIKISISLTPINQSVL